MHICINCGRDTLEYVGETYDDDEYLGSTYECSHCNFHFTISPKEQEQLDNEENEN